MLDSFIAVPTDKLRKSPNALYVRAVYSLVTLLKADYAVRTDAEMGELFESQNLKVQFYLDIVLKKTSEAAGSQECRNPSHWNFLLKEKLKSWWDEYQEWRKEGRDLKRRKTKTGNDRDPATGNQTPKFAGPNSHHATASPLGPSRVTTTQPLHPPQALQIPNFGLANSYPTQPSWNTNGMGLDTTTPTQQPLEDPAAYTHDMGDFSSAFQNGDLYLWNDLTADNFSGWVPQNGPYGGMGFGGMNSQGF